MMKSIVVLFIVERIDKNIFKEKKEVHVINRTKYYVWVNDR